jgi:hypothetical protein
MLDEVIMENKKQELEMKVNRFPKFACAQCEFEGNEPRYIKDHFKVCENSFKYGELLHFLKENFSDDDREDVEIRGNLRSIVELFLTAKKKTPRDNIDLVNIDEEETKASSTTDEEPLVQIDTTNAELCKKTHSCGHSCFGLKDEATCLPCLEVACCKTQFSQVKDSLCMIC